MMQTTGEVITLHEGAIAAEFGVSRTPIRQILQKLAHERLVETRSGVGTIVAPLNPAHRERDLIVVKELLRAASICVGDTPADLRMLDRLASAKVMADRAREDAQGYLNIRIESLEITSDFAPDPIIGDAIRAAQWRHIRWRMADHGWAEGWVIPMLRDVLRIGAERLEKGGPAAFYGYLADVETGGQTS